MKYWLALVAGVAVGAAYRLLAHQADVAHGAGASDFLTSLANLAAPWLAVPIIIGHGTRRAVLAGASAGAVAAAEVVTYYALRPGHEITRIAIVWLAVGALAAGVAGLTASTLGRRASASGLVGSLLLAEPIFVWCLLRALGRHPWHGWLGASAVELVAGAVLAGAAVARKVRPAPA